MRRALEQRRRAELLPAVLTLVRRADAERARGELDTAVASYREALALDPGWAVASTAIDEIHRELRDAEFERVLSEAFGLLGDENFTDAQTRFESALALRPSSREARDGLEQAEQGAKLDQIALAEARGLAFERRELWDQAIALYGSVLESDETLLFAQTGLERAEVRAGLDAKLTNLIDNPALLLHRLGSDGCAQVARSRGSGIGARAAHRRPGRATRPTRSRSLRSRFPCV